MEEKVKSQTSPGYTNGRTEEFLEDDERRVDCQHN
jgi:hypothetical protein